jgi:hypothetical protein
MFRERAPTRLRLTAVILLAYALALQGLLGALGAGAHAAEARLAAQLGLICTIHGIAAPEHASDRTDPSPGKLACIEHCLLPSGAGTGPVAAAGVPALPVAWAQVDLAPPVGASEAISPCAIPPPPRGPPAL